MHNNNDDRIRELKAQKDAVILAHYYVSPEIQAIADYVGDSFKLSELANSLPNKTIVFAGVQFMGESAKLLSPEKTVYLPEPCADCPMAHMVDKAMIDAARRTYDDLAVVCYVNSTAQVKSWSDICVTSSNALKVIKNLPNKHILFIPDRNLGTWIAQQVPEKDFHFAEGHCPIHHEIDLDEIESLKRRFPHAPVLVHPECNEAVVAKADFVGSTSQIIDFTTTFDAHDFIIGTVEGVSYKIMEATQGKEIRLHFPRPVPRCWDMDIITKDKVISALEGTIDEVALPSEEIADKARLTLTRMLELSR